MYTQCHTGWILDSLPAPCNIEMRQASPAPLKCVNLKI